MAAGKPVLCSEVTSLPEVVGDAAIQFDPRKPAEIVAAIERFASAAPEEIEAMVERGHIRVKQIGDRHSMARKYLNSLREVLSMPRSYEHGLHGVYPDGWTGAKFAVTYAAGGDHRRLMLKFIAPPETAGRSVVLHVRDGDVTERIVVSCDRGRNLVVERSLAANSRCLEFTVEEAFCPAEHGMESDQRCLGLRCVECTVVDRHRTINLLQESA
jgi:hypothetical protein